MQTDSILSILLMFYQYYLSNIDNYRGIALSPLFAKLFERCILDNYDYLLLSNYLQFGFK